MMPPMEKKETLQLPDVLDNLPKNVLDDILMRLPLRDAVRTSTLSKKWRYKWCKLPELTLDQTLCETRRDSIYPTNIFRKIIHNILTLHEGPIKKFSLRIPTLSRCPKIDESLFYFISRNGIQHLALRLPSRGKPYKLPCTFFTCFHLRHLTLECCSIHPPHSFKGFDRLISLELCDTIISSRLLESFICHCPLLEQLVLKTSESDVIEVNAPLLKSFDFTGCMECINIKNSPLLAKLSLTETCHIVVGSGNWNSANFFESFYALEQLHLNNDSVKFFAAGAGEVPKRLTFNLDSVKHLCLSSIYLDYDLDEVPCAISLIRSFPFLQYMEIQVISYGDHRALECLEVEGSSDVTFSHLKEVKLKGGLHLKPGMQLIKFMLAKSPVLVRMLIKPSRCGVAAKILAELPKFQRASPKAKVVCNRDNHLQ